MVTLFGRHLYTYEDLPLIMEGKMPFMDGMHGSEYVFPLPNGRYATVTDYSPDGLERQKEACLSQVRYYPNYGKTRHYMEVWVKFNLHSVKEATDFLYADEIVSRLENGTWWSCLDYVGGVGYYDNGELVTILSCPNTRELREYLESMG